MDQDWGMESIQTLLEVNLGSEVIGVRCRVITWEYGSHCGFWSVFCKQDL